MATEKPIFVESLSSQFAQSFRATSVDGQQHFPATYDTVWDPSGLPPPLPPAGLSPNGAPVGNVQLAVVTLQPGPQANTFQFLAASPPVVLPPPLLVASIDRVIPNTWGGRALIPGAYQQSVTDASGAAVPYAEVQWVVDGVNHFLEFPYGVPSGFLSGGSAPTLSFYRYTGGIASGGGGGGGITGGMNEGSGARVFDPAASTVSTLVFRTLVAGTDLAIVEDAPAPGEITIGRAPVPDAVDLYVNAVTGSDITGDGTAGSPYQTLERAFRDIRVSGWNDTAFVNVQTTSPPLTLATGLVTLSFGALGAQAHDVVVRGEPRAAVLADTVATIVVDPVSKLITIGGAAGPYPPGYVGKVVRFTSGALAAYAIQGIAPPATVQVEAFVGKVDGGGALVLAFDGGGVAAPAPGDSFVIEDIVTAIAVTGTAVLDVGVGGSLVFRDLEFTSDPAAFTILGYKDFTLQMFASRLRPGAGGALILGSVGGTFIASTQNENSTTVPSTAGIAVLPEAGATFVRAGNSTMADAVADSAFLGNVFYQGSFALRSSYAAASAPDGVLFSASAYASSVLDCWFECDGQGTPDGPAIMWATTSTCLQVDSVRSSAGPSSAVLYTTDGGMIQVGATDISGCRTALFAGRGGVITLTNGTAVAGGGGGAVVTVREGGSLTAAQSLTVTAAAGSSAISVRAGVLTVDGNLTASAADADCIILDGGATLRRLLVGLGAGLTASHSAPAPGSAGIRVRGGSRVVAWDLSVPGGNSGTGVSVESGSSLQASGVLTLTATDTGLFVQRGQVACEGSASVAPGANTGVHVVDGSLSADSLFCDQCASIGVQVENGDIAIAAACSANACGGAGVRASTSKVLVGGVLTARDSPIGVSLSGSQLTAAEILADSPTAFSGQGLNLASSSVNVGGAGGGGVLTASSVGLGRSTGILASDDSEIVAVTIIANGCSGDGVNLAGSSLRGRLSASGNGGNGVVLRSSRLAITLADASGNSLTGIAATDQSTVTASVTAAGNAATGIVADHGSSLLLDTGSAVTDNTGPGVYVGHCGTCTVRGTDISRNTLSGILVERCSQVNLEADVGTTDPNGAYGLEVHYGSKAMAAGTLTLTGTSGDVGLGSSGPVTWATLAGRVPATATDLFNPTTEQCGVIVG